MRIYTVYEPPGPGVDPERDVVFVKEGFCWPALFIPLVWLLYRRLWLVLVLYVAGAIVVAGGAAWFGVSQTLQGAVGSFAGLWVAAEANNFRRWTLARRGYECVAVICSENLGEAELRYFTRNLAPATGSSALATSTAEAV